MFKKLLLTLASAFLAASAFSQTTTSATYTLRAQRVERLNGVIDTADESTCPDTLVVNIPAGNYIYSVDAAYAITAYGQVWTSDTRSYVECVTTNKKEAAVFPGLINTAGTEAFSRTNLTFTTGVTAVGQLKFVLHTFRNFGVAGCDTTNAKVLKNTFTITVHHGVAPTCFPPTNLAVNWTMSNKAQLSWTSGGATNWQIEYGAPGFTLGSGTLVNASTNPFVLSGLTANTTYQFYVRDNCGTNNQSIWTNGGNFTTLCAPTNAPYLESFTSAAWTVGADAAAGTINTCWNRASTTTYWWKPRTGNTPTIQSGPTADHTTGTGKYLYTETSNGGTTTTISSPPINLATVAVPELSFYYHMFGAQINKLEVEINSGGTWTVISTITGQQQTSEAAPWLQKIISLSAYAGDTVLIRFKATRNPGNQNQVDIAIDDVDIHAAPPCPKPGNLAVTASASTSVTLSWTTGGATSWQIEYGAPGFTLGSGTVVNATSNPFTVTGLALNTSYQFYVRDNCGANGTSAWEGPVSATTLCGVLATPYTENFDGTAWTVNGDAAPGVIDPCWTRTNTTLYWWKPRTGGTPTPQSGPTSDHTTSTGKYLYTETSNNFGSSTTVASPPLNLVPLTAPELSFYYHMYGQEINKLEVEVNDGSGWTVVSTLTGQQQTSETAAWLERTVSLAAYAGDTIQIRFKGTRNNGMPGRVDISIDDVSVKNAPTCPKPTNFVATTSTSSSVTLSWTTGGASNWQIEYGLSGFVPGAGTLVNAATNPFTVSGLNAGLAYQFYVRDSCGLANTSTWTGPITYSTACGIVAAPFTENFDGAAWLVNGNPAPGVIDPCWTRSSTTVYWWKPRTGDTPSNLTGPTKDHTTGTGKYIYTETSNGGTSTTITSPSINLSTITNPELSFYYHMYGAEINKLEVEINNGGTAWSVISTITGQQQTIGSAAWIEKIVPLSAYAGDTVQIRFKGTRNVGNQNRVDISIDDFAIRQTPTCPKPSLLSTGTVTTTSVQVLWTTGGATNWQIEYGPVGHTPGTGIIVNATTNPFVVTGLTPNTGYSFYVRDSCGLGDVSLWEGPDADTTLCGIYAAPFTENFDGTSWIVGVGGFAAGTVDACWVRSSSTQYWWKPGTGQTTTPQTGPTGDHTTGSGKYIYTESNTGSVVTSILTPQINLNTLTTPELRFWYHMFGTQITKLKIQINNGNGWVNLDSILAPQQTAITSPWLEKVVNLSAYLGDTIQLRFTGYKIANNQNRADICVDDVTIKNAPTCPNPSNFVSTANTATTVTLNWTTGGATNWQIQYGPTGFVLGTGTIVSTSAKPYTLSPLTPNTSYQFYVRDSCAVGDVSTWVGPITVTTPCGTYTAPFTENFDGTNWVVGVGGFAAGTVDACWVRSATAQYWWKPGTGQTPTAQTGPTGDHTTGSGKYLYTESQNGSVVTSILTPNIDLATLTTPELRFWYHMFGAQITKLKLQINSGSGWVNLDSVLAPQQTTLASPWLEKVVNLSAYTGTVVQIRFTGYKIASNLNQADICVDDITIKNAPNCPNPTNLTSTASTTTSVTLSWTTGGATRWQVEYGPVGFTLGAGTLVNAATNPFTVTGLSPSQTYDFYVRDSCGIADVSTWLGPKTTSTACGTVLAPYFENFDSGFNEGTGTMNDNSTISACWTRNPDSAYHWGGGTGPVSTAGTGPASDHTSGFGNYVYVESSLSPNGSVALLESPSINLTPLNTPEMHFWYHMWAQTGSMGTLRWEIFSNNAWTVLDSLVGNQGNAWQEVVVNLAAYSNQTIKIRFRGKKASGITPQQGDMAVDDLSIVEAPGCPVPTNVTATPLSMTSIQVAWFSGGGASWQVEYGPTGFTPGSGTLISTTANPFVLNGLPAATCYDFYVRDVCSPTDLSAWVGPINACTFSCTNGCTYTIKLTDSFGNGWRGDAGGTMYHTLIVENGSSTSNYTLHNGLDSTFTLNVCDGDTIRLSFAINGTFSNQCGVVLRDYSNAIIYQNSAAMVAGPLFTTIADCSNPCPAPLAVFTTSNTNLAVTFNAASSNGNTLTYAWDFGDGTTGTGVNPAHNYAADGVYTIQLVVTDICGQTDTTTQTITICGVLTASFTIAQNGLDVTVNASALTNAATWSWNFGDGTTGTGAIVTHTYATTGVYNITLAVTNICGQTANTSTIVTVCIAPKAHWSYTILSSGASGMQVQFDGSTSIGGNTYSWNFGDGTTNTTSAYPIHTYSVPGLFYIVTLVVTNSCGDDDTLTASLASIGVDELAADHWNVYPNPVQDWLNVEMPANAPEKSFGIRMLSTTGQIVFEGNLTQENKQIYTGDLADGMYILEIISQHNISRRQIIITH